MGKNAVKITIAISDYDHVRDLTNGVVPVEGIELQALDLQVEEIFYRFLKFREFDVCELSFAKYVSLVSQPGCDVTAIPVFPSRVFRQSSFYVRSDGPTSIEEIRGLRVGIPEWAQTASVYSRGYLTETVGIPLTDIEWVQAGVNDPGRVEKVSLRIPQGVSYRSEPAKSLNEMLLSGEVDVVMSAHAPHSIEEGDYRVRRILVDYQQAEYEYWQQTKIFPIMHVVAVKKSVLEENPWIAMNLLKAFEEAKRRSIERLFDVTASRFPLPWSRVFADQISELFGSDGYWPYGVEPNRVTLSSFLRFTFDQGVTHKPLEVEDLFPAGVQSSFKV
ncbi:MAG: 4,5-dihydroxyphthalate decarboxylase [Actinomycetota bacterium]|nr:4,5-dihydroxyphthalate decarboxylase [Actinomycetota bacterium]